MPFRRLWGNGFSKYSHNRIYGEDYVLGKEASKLAEGVETVKAVYLLAKKHNIEMPICETVYSILYENAEPKKKLFGLFERSLKKEFWHEKSENRFAGW